MGRGHWSLTSTTITTNLELTRLLKLVVQSVTSFRRLASCIVGKTEDFSDFLINTSQYQVSISEAFFFLSFKQSLFTFMKIWKNKTKSLPEH